MPNLQRQQQQQDRTRHPVRHLRGPPDADAKQMEQEAMTPTQRAAAQRVIDAWYACGRYPDSSNDIAALDAAITKLHAALTEQPAEQVGTTLRDYFAAKAMPVHMAALSTWDSGGQEAWHNEVARLSYATADAMLSAGGAMSAVIAAMQADPEYAWSWHCNVAMAFVDAGGDHYTANQGAARFMRLLANVEPAHDLPEAPQPAKSAEQAPVAQRWQPIETAPKGRIVLVYYKNSLGNGRTMRARYYLPETLDSDTTESGWADEGWYEESEAYEYLMPLEHDPTHWMPLPAGPDTAPQPAIPPGYKLVPAEPTDEMVDAACDESDLFRVDFVRAWDAAINASPELTESATSHTHKVVPVTPTKEMLISGARAPVELLSPDGAHQVYQAMLAAATEAPQPGKRVPLTREELADAWLSVERITNATERQIAFARAVIAAYDAKNGITGEPI